MEVWEKIRLNLAFASWIFGIIDCLMKDLWKGKFLLPAT